MFHIPFLHFLLNCSCLLFSSFCNSVLLRCVPCYIPSFLQSASPWDCSSVCLSICKSSVPRFTDLSITWSIVSLSPTLLPFLLSVSGHWINHENLLRRNPCLEYFQRPFFCLHFSVQHCLNHLLEHRTCGGGGDGGDIVKWHVSWKTYPLNNIRLNSVKKVYLIITAPHWEHRKLVGAP